MTATKITNEQLETETGIDQKMLRAKTRYQAGSLVSFQHGSTWFNARRANDGKICDIQRLDD